MLQLAEPQLGPCIELSYRAGQQSRVFDEWQHQRQDYRTQQASRGMKLRAKLQSTENAALVR